MSRPFTNADIGQYVLILSGLFAGQFGRVAQIREPGKHDLCDGSVLISIAYGCIPKRYEELERGKFVTRWEPDNR